MLGGGVEINKTVFTSQIPEKSAGKEIEIVALKKYVGKERDVGICDYIQDGVLSTTNHMKVGNG